MSTQGYSRIDKWKTVCFSKKPMVEQNERAFYYSTIYLKKSVYYNS